MKPVWLEQSEREGWEMGLEADGGITRGLAGSGKESDFTRGRRAALRSGGGAPRGRGGLSEDRAG